MSADVDAAREALIRRWAENMGVTEPSNNVYGEQFIALVDALVAAVRAEAGTLDGYDIAYVRRAIDAYIGEAGTLDVDGWWAARYIAAHRSDAVGQRASREMSRRSRDVSKDWTTDDLNARLAGAEK